MAKGPKKELTRGQPKKPENLANPTQKYGELPKKIIGSHMGHAIADKPISLINTGGEQREVIPESPKLGKPPKLPPRPRTSPPK